MESDMTTEILVGIIIALVSGIAGTVIGSNHKVQKPLCDQMRASCQALILEKLDNMSDKLDTLAKVVDTKLLGL